MVLYILLTIAAILVIFVIVVAMQPSEFRIARAATFPAPPPAVFAQVNDFHNWDAWSPWAKLDPAAKATFEGAPAGTGAIFKWSGNKKVGEGTMTITESPAKRILIYLSLHSFEIPSVGQRSPSWPNNARSRPNPTASSRIEPVAICW